MKKHEVLETEVKVREKLVKSVQKTGECLVSEEHFASEDILEKNKTLLETWEKLMQTMDERKRKLHASLKVQKVRESVKYTLFKYMLLT